MKEYRKAFILWLKGLAMGSADVVPGVSGGTVALIAGIYTELIDTLKSIDGEALALLLRFRFRDFWYKINGGFLLPLLTGIGTALFSLARLITYLLQHYPIAIWSFFFGLIVASVWLVSKEVKQWNAGSVLAFMAGTVVAYWLTAAMPAETPEALWFVFLSGAIAICAMILPGISGSFILVLLGKYAFILESLKALRFEVMLTFAAGCVVGLLSFVRLLSYLLHRFPSVTMATLSGFMLGSLNKIWPWKEVISTNAKGVPVLTRNVLPASYEQLSGQEAQPGIALACCIAGIALIVILEKVSQTKEVAS
ncbi:DUF368 domain-containing protein [Thermonema rossianum]|uniref:DUF368 domain-containing protein n=1 Tax=Thermonema rossianum TaxID=55505 RepID=UPI0005701F49|nr:DUF368 domain-containing protein [Thermonema rossianum]